METKIEALEDNRATVSVSFEAKDIDTRIAKKYKEFANQYNFPGFRKGKAPRPIIDSALGKDAVRASVTDELINDSYPLAVEEADLYPTGQPEFGDPDFVAAGEPYSFTFSVDVKPVFELSSYEPVDIKLPAPGASEAEIDEQVEVVCGHYFDYVDADADTPVALDSHLDVSMKAVDDAGQAIDSLTFESRSYALGENLMPAAFDEQLVGLKQGDVASFSIDVPEEGAPVMLIPFAGKTATIAFEVQIESVKDKVRPELTDEWVSETLGFESVAELRRILGESIEQQKESVTPRLREQAVLEAVGERLQGEPPEAVVEESERTLLQDFFQQLQNQGASFDNYLAQQNMSSDDFKRDVHRQAVDVAAQDMALDAWAKHFDLGATPEEVEIEFQLSGVEDPQKLLEEWRTSGQLHLVREAVTRKKAVTNLMDTANVTDIELTADADAASEEAPAEEAATAEAPAEEAAE